MIKHRSRYDMLLRQSNPADAFTPTEYLVMEVLVARWRLGLDTWTFPTQLRKTLYNLARDGFLNYKSGIAPGSLNVWLTEQGAKELGLDKPFMINGVQVGRVWEKPW